MAWEMYEPNPIRTGAIDCAVRAIAKALDVSWEKAHVMLSVNSFLMGSVQVDDDVWGSILRQHGFKRQIVSNSCPNCYTVDMFCEDHPKGTYVVKSQDHVATVRNGTLFDSWPSGGKTVLYFWYRPDENIE